MAKRNRELTQTERNRVRAATGSLARYRNLARTYADRPAVSTAQIQARNAAQAGRSADYARTGVQNNGQSIRGRRAEGISARTGNAVAGAQHNRDYRRIRSALGMAAG